MTIGIVIKILYGIFAVSFEYIFGHKLNLMLTCIVKDYKLNFRILIRSLLLNFEKSKRIKTVLKWQ